MIEYYWMAAIGICFILKYGSILEKFRTKTSEVLPILKKLYKCCLCMGFWVGCFISIFLNLEIQILLFPFTCSAVCWIADLLVTALINFNYALESESEDSKPNK